METEMTDNVKRYHIPGHILLSALAELEVDLKHNYEKGTTQQRALANIAGPQGDLFSSYLILLWQGPLVGRSVVLRSILENQGNIVHTKGSDVRSESYLKYADKMRQQAKNRVASIKTSDEDLKWSRSDISTRVSKVDESSKRLYDTLSDFVHGNNVSGYMNTPEFTDAYITAIDSYFVGLFIGFMAELGIGLELSDEKRKLIFDAIYKAGKTRTSDYKEVKN